MTIDEARQIVINAESEIDIDSAVDPDVAGLCGGYTADECEAIAIVLRANQIERMRGGK